ncbi:MAG: PEGA domain-containing protein [Pseudomonadota bacterium]
MRSGSWLVLTILCCLGCQISGSAPVVDRPDPGTLIIDSVPPGAQVSIDGEPAGQTPYRLGSPASATSKIPSHRVVLTLDGHARWSRTLTLVPHTAQQLTVYLQGRPGPEDDDTENEDDLSPSPRVPFDIVGVAGLQVEIDGRALASRTPLRGEALSVGTHEVQLVDALGQRHSYRVRVEAPGPAVLSVPRPGATPLGNAFLRDPDYLGCSNCEAQTGDSPAAGAAPSAVADDGRVELAVNTHPPARLFIDGKDSGMRTPVFPSKALRLSPGEHELTFQTASGSRYMYRVRLHERGLNKLLIKKLGGPPQGNVEAESLGGSAP